MLGKVEDQELCTKIWIVLKEYVKYLSKNIRNLCFSVCLSCLSTSHLAGVLLRTQGRAMSSVKLFGWAVLQKAARSSNGRQPNGLFRTGTFWTGTQEPQKQTSINNKNQHLHFIVTAFLFKYLTCWSTEPKQQKICVTVLLLPDCTVWLPSCLKWGNEKPLQL